jgi:hypothetical protein
VKRLHLTDVEREAAWALEVDRAVAGRGKPRSPVSVDELRDLIRATQARQEKNEVRRAA